MASSEAVIVIKFMSALPKQLFIRESLLEALDMPADFPEDFNPAGIVQMVSQNTTPAYWYQKLNLKNLEERFGLPRGIMYHLIDIESKGKLDAVSKKGAKSLFGIMPGGISGFTGNINDPGDTALFAAKTLSQLIHHFGGSIEHGLAAYNWGMGNLARKGLHRAPKQTKNYIKFFKEKGMIPKNGSWGEEDQVGSWGEIAGMKP